MNKLMLIDWVLQVLFTRFKFTEHNYNFDQRELRLYFLVLQRFYLDFTQKVYSYSVLFKLLNTTEFVLKHFLPISG